MTAEELKVAVRAYADEHLPGWACAGVLFRIGELGAHVSEELCVLNPNAPPLSAEPVLVSVGIRGDG